VACALIGALLSAFGGGGVLALLGLLLLLAGVPTMAVPELVRMLGPSADSPSSASERLRLFVFGPGAITGKTVIALAISIVVLAVLVLIAAAGSW
jgi:hypothetical protein